ncbi:LPS export ABC transporter ATP-binding protein [Candidatus Synechococcus spongiarum LMB bulk10E]|uniref:LPS export ABC transporter ATP-binding protein n=2 Tax=Candidatus Synechococcus spongiarum TaxID=431041 RepID=A0A1T1CSG9_9SYNE|nr:LPS export ABC transporter ATP-binding protein [Candidatus Synechococcus spongiarum]MCY4359961.1 LPS export ABC transporter ATP-binding protein [Cyanobacteria bacterium MAG APA_bin_95]OOV31353.1 LPS export ABC transporter ATP-binding protein [Candidatus Synechococcus spongiarum LMB bulk15M]OOV35403.1 LPS export ABC transporter ATP-binding protein [Candidatus Synechococcus spongiarum LMB bulk10E]OOV35764.1 LPS export ABC transporter ATP-binding protein [Candidatus Synechococcus spongiarum LMB
MSLELKGINLSLAGRQLIRSLDMHLELGEVVGLLGPNGAGKTTTFNLIIGQLQPDHGDVLLDGHSITTLTMPQRARMGLGYLPQEASVFRSLTVRENLLLGLEQSRLPAPERHQRLNQLVADFHLEPFLQRRGTQLSGGERRRTEVARALAVGARGPRYLLLDEPFAGVDPLAVHDLQTLILSLKQKQVGLLITDHNVRETLSITDRAYILNEGAVLASGSSQAVASDPLVKQYYLGESFTI